MDITLVKTTYRNAGDQASDVNGRTTTETWVGGRIDRIDEKARRDKLLGLRRVLDEWMRADNGKHTDRLAIINFGQGIKDTDAGKAPFVFEVVVGEDERFATWADLLDYADYLMENIEAIIARAEATREAKRKLDAYLLSDLLNRNI